MFIADKDDINYEEQIKDSLSGLHWQSDGEVCLNSSNLIVWASDDFERIFNLSQSGSRGRSPGKLLKIVGLDEWIINAIQQTLNSASQLEGFALSSFLARTQVYASGSNVEARPHKPPTMVILTFAPFLIEKALYFGLFFNERRPPELQPAEKLTSDPWITKANFVVFLWKNHRGLLILALIIGGIAAAVGNVDKLEKIIKVMPKEKESCQLVGTSVVCEK